MWFVAKASVLTIIEDSDPLLTWSSPAGLAAQQAPGLHLSPLLHPLLPCSRVTHLHHLLCLDLFLNADARDLN